MTFFYIKTLHNNFSILNHLKSEVENSLSIQLNKNLKIGKISENWDNDFNLIANIEDIKLGKNSLFLKKLDIKIDIIESIKQQKILIKKIILNKPELTFKYDKENKNWYLKGLKFGEENVSHYSFDVKDFYFLNNLDMEFKNILIKTEKNNKATYVLLSSANLFLNENVLNFEGINDKNKVFGTYDLKNKILNVNAKGDYFSFESLIKKTPLIEYYKYINHNWIVSANIDLNVDIDFNKIEEYEIKINIDKGKMIFKTVDDLFLKNISGILTINKKDMFVGNLKTKLYGNHVNVSLSIDDNDDFVIDSYGYTNIKKVNDIWLKNDFLGNLNGGSIFKSKITIGKNTKIELHSNLEGISSTNPYPFLKKEKEKVNFIFEYNIDNQNTFIHYNDHNVKIKFKENKLDQVLVGFNKLTPKTKNEGIFIEGVIDNLNIDNLYAYLDSKFNLSKIKEGNNSIKLKKININGKNILFKERVFNNYSLNLLLNEKENYLLNFKSDEIETKFTKFKDNHYEMIIDKLNINIEEEIKTKSNTKNISLNFLKNGYIFINDIDFLEEKYFDVEIEIPKGEMLILNIFSKYKNTIISSNIIYDESKNVTFLRGNNDNTTIIKGKNLYELRERDNPKYPYKSQDYNFDININWVGTPLMFNKNTLNGFASVNINNLEIDNIKENYLSMKIFNIFNLSNVFEYLTFDFDNINSQKAKFKNISGLYKIKNGVMTTNNLKLKGENLTIEIKGNINLVNETIDKKIYIEAPITDKVPLLSLLAGVSPQTAGVIFLVEKLIGDELNKIFKIKMKVFGKWKDVQVKK
jgi:uncharacterized protein YhdP